MPPDPQRSDQVVVVVGNPKPESRTCTIASSVGRRLAEITQTTPELVIDLAKHPEALLRWGDPLVSEWRNTVLSAKALVVACPTYKASFTGLLKLFLDTFDQNELEGTLTIAVMTGGFSGHSLAVQHHLIPVLTEIGASCPSPGLFLSGPEVDDPEPSINSWFTKAHKVLQLALGSPESS